jgi:hypothetical protein
MSRGRCPSGPRVEGLSASGHGSAVCRPAGLGPDLVDDVEGRLGHPPEPAEPVGGDLTDTGLSGLGTQGQPTSWDSEQGVHSRVEKA